MGSFSASGARGPDDAQAVRAGMAAIGMQPAQRASDKPGQQAPPVPQESMRVPVEVLDRYVGEYELASGQVVVTMRWNGDTLLGHPTGAPEAVVLVPVSHPASRRAGVKRKSSS